VPGLLPGLLGIVPAPFVLGLMLGDLLDTSLRRDSVLSGGEIEPFLTRPISALLAVIVVLTLAMNIPPVRAAWDRARDRLLGRGA
jgi:putative tricarboxylic transport membrane protein